MPLSLSGRQTAARLPSDPTAKLKRSDLAGGRAQVLCDAARLTGGSWGKDGIIVFLPDFRETVVQVSAQGGEPQPVAMKTADNAMTDTGILTSCLTVVIFFSAGSRKALGSARLIHRKSNKFCRTICRSLMRRQVTCCLSATMRSSRKRSTPTGSRSRAMSCRFITGQANDLGASRRFSVSNTGVLLWQGKWQRDYQLVWFDREGKQTGTVDAAVKTNTGQDPHISLRR
jgi:hypothetical protein